MSCSNGIDRLNVSRIEVAWTYRSGDGIGNIQCNTIVIGGTLYTPTPGKNLVALDPDTGKPTANFGQGGTVSVPKGTNREMAST